MSDRRHCPVCSEGYLVIRREERETEYHGRRDRVSMVMAVCDACGSEIAGDEESRINKREIIRFRKSVDGLLPGGEILSIRKHFSLSQKQAAKIFGGGPVAFSKYENDDVAHSEAMDSLLRLVQRSEDAYRKLAAIQGMEILLRRKCGNYVFRWDVGNVINVEFERKAG
jgi:HTH-type transcriptional regulator/antitoxin MqsA